MSDELRIHAPLPIVFLLKRENDEHLVHIIANYADPSAPPRPQLRTYVIDHADTRLFHFLGQTKVELREIQEHRHSRRVVQAGAKNFLKRRVIHAQMSQRFSWADTCKETNMAKELNSFPLHRVAAGSEELEGIPGSKGSQLARKTGPISVGRGLSRYYKDAFHAS